MNNIYIKINTYNKLNFINYINVYIMKNYLPLTIITSSSFLTGRDLIECLDLKSLDK